MSKRNQGKTARSTMFEFQEMQIDACRELNNEHYVEILELQKSNDDLKKIIIDLLDKNCKKSFKESVSSFIFQDAKNNAD